MMPGMNITKVRISPDSSRMVVEFIVSDIIIPHTGIRMIAKSEAKAYITCIGDKWMADVRSGFKTQKGKKEVELKDAKVEILKFIKDNPDKVERAAH
jgi:hypothetical protein